MAITYAAAIQDRIAYAVYGQANSALTTAQKAQLDGGWTTGSLTTGVAKDALDRVNQIAQWFALAGATAAPAEWAHWFVREAAYLLASNVRPDRADEFRQQREVAIDAALDSFSLTSADSASAANRTFTLRNLRYYVLNHCARRKESGANTGLRRRIFPPVEDIDDAVASVINEVWNMAPWVFRKRKVTFSLPEDYGGVVNSSLTDDNEIFDAIVSREVYYTDEAGRGAKARWLSADEFCQLEAVYGSATGRPVGFRIETANDQSTTWQFVPFPDRAYTFIGVATVKAPSVLSDATSATLAFQFPVEFKPILRDMILGRVLLMHGASDAQAVYGRAEEKANALLPIYADIASGARVLQTLDVYKDVQEMTGCQHLGGAM